MNCERCQEMLSDLLDGSISRQDEVTLHQHLGECIQCADVRRDLESIVGFSRTLRGDYPAPANERAMWLRIRNTIEAEQAAGAMTTTPVTVAPARRFGWLSHSWQLTLPQLAASVAAIAIVVALSTAVGLRRLEHPIDTIATENPRPVGGYDINQHNSQQQQLIKYWNARIEVNRARWSPEMRNTFDRNLGVIDQAVNDSIKELNNNPQDEVSREMLNAALNDKIALLKDFSEL